MRIFTSILSPTALPVALPARNPSSVPVRAPMPAPAAVPSMGMKEPMAAPAAGTESGIGAACSDCSTNDGSCFFRDPVSDNEFTCVAAWAGWYEFFHEHLLDG